MTPESQATLLDAVRAIAEDAGRAIMAIYRGSFSVTEKDDRSPLTAADLAAHRSILAGLAALTPDWPVLSEEAASNHGPDRHRWQRFWLVDPLDGTREFIKKNGEFSVNIALIEAHKSVLGIVHAPVTGQSWMGARGIPGFRVDADRQRQPLRVQSPAPQCLRVAGSRSHADPRLEGFLNRAGRHHLHPMGSALKFCLVAEGRADVYLRFGATSEWDTAAGQAVLEAAGGQVCDHRLQPLAYNTRPSLINPDFIAFADPGKPWLDWLHSDETTRHA